MGRRAEITGFGHPAARMSDHQSLELLCSDDWSNRPAAIGYRASFEGDILSLMRGRIGVTIRCDDLEDRFEATLGPDRHQMTSILFRRDPATRARCFAFQASKAAADLSPALRDRLREPDARIVVSLAELGDDLAASGGLFLVGMPIGNQGDLGARALDVLSRVDVVFAEDTRAALDALAWRGVKTPIVSCHDHNEARRADELAGRFAAGQRIAYVSDAGMPVVSDPGFALVRAALSAGAYVTVVPGPSAVLAALALSGLPATSFRFLGFPPRKSGERATFLAAVLDAPETSIVFESGQRIDDVLAEIAGREGTRAVALCRDLTKTSEFVERGAAREVLERRRVDNDVRGEYVLVVAGAGTPAADTAADSTIRKFIEALVAEDCPTAPIVKALRGAGLMGRAEAYTLIESLKGRDR